MKRLVMIILLAFSIMVFFCSPALAQDGDSPVPADEIILSTTSLELEEGDTYRLRADVLPTNARMDIVKWRSDDDTVATVTGRPGSEPATSIGLIRAHGNGEATITVFIDDGSDDPLTAECTVVVGPADPATDPSDPVEPIATPPTGGSTVTNSLYLIGLIALVAAFTTLKARKACKKAIR